MKIKEFAGLVKGGVHPVIEFRKEIEEHEGYAEPGMRGRVTGSRDHYDCRELDIDFTEFDSFNQRLESANYYNKDGKPVLTARQAGWYKEKDRYYFGEDYDASLYFEVVESENLKLHEQYLSSGLPVSYVRWLEDQVTKHQL